MEFTSEILQSLAKRAWKISWILVLNIMLSLIALIIVFASKNIDSLDTLLNINSTTLGAFEFLLKNILWSFLLFSVFYILKGDSDQTIKKMREKYYSKIIERIDTVFEYRYNFPEDNYDEDGTIKRLTEYAGIFRKNQVTHRVTKDNLKSFIVSGVDSLYIIYQAEDSLVLFSVWHSGDFIAISIAINKESTTKDKKIIEDMYKNTLNLSLAHEYVLSERDVFWWFDIKYRVSEEFLFSNIEQEKISRIVAHIVTVSLGSALELQEWQKV